MAKAVSGFIATGSNYSVPSGQTLLIMQTSTWDGSNLGVSYTISKSGYSETVQADASGRAVKMVPSGSTYTVTLTHNGTYDNDGPQTVVANTEEIAWVDFKLIKPNIIIFSNVNASTWASDSTYSGFVYRASIALAGVTSSDIPEVTFDPAQANSGNYAPVAQTYNGGVYIYSKVNTTISIPTITIRRT